ncbi:MAG: hypothetical protein PHW60_10445 [Kiritimatiellae bacterium]|nr:hypothetical protein [Kiritimatiellia bacterium]
MKLRYVAVNLTQRARIVMMSAFFVLGTGGAVYCQDAGADGASVPYAYVVWGKYVEGDACAFEETPPSWVLGAYKTGAGEWATNPPSWRVEAMETAPASLNLDLDRNLLRADGVRCWIHYFDVPNGSLYLDLLNSNGVAIASATNLFGNLQQGSNLEAVVCLDIPLPLEAAVIQLRRGSGETRVYESLLYVDESGADLQGQARASYYYAAAGGGGMNDGRALQALSAKLNGAHGVNNPADNRRGRRSAVGSRAGMAGAVHLRVFTHLE